MKLKRCKLVRMSPEARVLKELRIRSKLSMFDAGHLIGRSDSYISHVENGRADVPKDKLLKNLLASYNCTELEFQLMVKDERPDPES